jgi:hypothetical protein
LDGYLGSFVLHPGSVVTTIALPAARVLRPIDDRRSSRQAQSPRLVELVARGEHQMAAAHQRGYERASGPARFAAPTAMQLQSRLGLEHVVVVA